MDDPQLDPLTPSAGATATPPILEDEPAVRTKGPQLAIPMADEVFTQWTARVDAAKRFNKDLRERWKTYVQAYMARYLKYLPEQGRVVVPLEYAYVELKAAQLAFQVPEVHLKARNPTSAPAVPLFQAALNFELGDTNADVKTCVDACLIDVLLCGITAAKVGYLAHKRTRQVLVLGPPSVNPLTGQPIPPAPIVDPATGGPILQQEEYIAAEEYFVDHIPTEHLLVPIEFVGANFDRAGWLGYVDEIPVSMLPDFGLTEDDVHVITTPPETLSSDQFPTRDRAGFDKRVRRVELFYQAMVYDRASNPFPGQYRKLVLLDGYKGGPVAHEDSPYQWVGDGQEGRPADGKLHGMEGNPITVLTIRVLPGSAYPLTDIEMGLPQSQEISLGRTQMMQHRDRAKSFRAYNREKLADPEIVEKLKRGEANDWIGVDGNIQEIFGIISPAQFPRDNFEFNQIGQTDFDRTWAISNAGTLEPEARTATEVRRAAGASDVRLDKERTWVLRWFVRCATRFASLLQQYMTEARWVEIVGADGQQAMQAWDRTTIQGEFVFSAKPDSALRMDADVERRQIANLYNLARRDPNVRGDELLKVLFLRHNMDPEKMIAPTPPPAAPKPEPPKISLALKAEDLANPQVLGLLAQMGFEILPPIDPATGQPVPRPQPQNGGPPAPGAAASLPHPGAALQMDVLSKHALRGGGTAPEIGER